MNVQKEGNELVIRIPLTEPRPSKTGKSDIVATTSGFAPSTVSINGKPVRVSLTAII